MDAALQRGSRPLVKPGKIELRDDVVSAALPASARPIPSATLLYTKDEGPWQKRVWQVESAEVREGRVVGRLPGGFEGVCFLALRDDRGWRTSSEHIEVRGGKIR